MKQRSKPQVILWDIGNVLIQPVHKQLFDFIYSLTSGLERNEFDRQIKILLDDSFYGLIDLDETWDTIRCISQLNEGNIARAKQLAAKNDCNRGLIEAIKQAANNGYRIGIVSDLSQIGYETVKQNIPEFLGLCEERLTFISIKLNLTKLREGPDFFNLVLAETGVRPSKVIVVDDNKNTVDFVRSLGAQSFLFNKKETQPDWEQPNQEIFKRFSEMGIT